MTKRLLFVAYLFPPVGGAGVQRATKFVKYLPQFGWDVTVLTAENPSVPVFDESLLADIPRETTIVKAKTLEPGYALKRAVSAANSTDQRSSEGSSLIRRFARTVANTVLQPDPQILWHHHAVDAGLRALSEKKHDAIVVTAPPFSSLLVGAELSRRTGLPLVLDYRDEWDISNAYWENKRHGAWSRWLQQRLQHRAVRVATALVATTRHSAEALTQVATRVCGDRAAPIVTHIYNGYDADDLLADSATSSDLAVSTTSDVYKLAYVGTLWNLTSVEPLVDAAVRLSREAPELAARLELHFAGRRTGPQEALLDRLNGLPCRVVRHPYLDHDAALRLMQSADGLCLLLSDLPHVGRVVPAKLFEYMAIGKPLLAIAPHGEVSELLGDCPFGFIHHPNDVTGITRRLGDEIERHRLRIPIPTGLWTARQFERHSLTGELAQLLDQISGHSASGLISSIRRSLLRTRRSSESATVEVAS